MISIKSLLPYVANIDGENIIFFFDQENFSIYSNEEISNHNKELIANEIKSQIFQNQSVSSSFDYQMALQLEKEFQDMKENHDHRAHELPNIE